MEIRLLPEQTKRVETGPVQFGNDWPGIYIRGDNAGHYAMILKTLIEGGGIAKDDFITQAHLRSLQEVLAGSLTGPASTHVAIPTSTRDEKC